MIAVEINPTDKIRNNEKNTKACLGFLINLYGINRHRAIRRYGSVIKKKLSNLLSLVTGSLDGKMFKITANRTK